MQLNVDPNTDADALEANVADASVHANADSWRAEVATRLARYRTRRKPSIPRYPSLLLPFDAPESWSRPASARGSATAPALPENDFVFPPNEASGEATESEFARLRDAAEEPASEPRPHYYSEPPPEQYGNVIEFPRSAAIPIFHPSDLADPILDPDRPRIVEVPEILPPPPALGGMLMEPAHRESVDKQTDAESPAASASIARRALGALVDAALLTTALAAFTAIFLRLNAHLTLSLSPKQDSVRASLPLLAAALAGIAIALWVAYEFLFVVYTGSTPGLRAARLRLAAFDGSPVNRRLRRWRVLASLLSAFSLGLGYLWCFLDRDGLCWHDRITRTHLQSAAQAE
jgi:uncharacterized RDD family membrane protein YckC